MESKGCKLIEKERIRQVKKEKWTSMHDDNHDEGDLAMAAVCYAAPRRIFIRLEHARGVEFIEPWPWGCMDDKRMVYGSERDPEEADGELPHPDTYSPEERLDLLIKAGALIAAEIDRMIRKLCADYALRCHECNDYMGGTKRGGGEVIPRCEPLKRKLRFDGTEICPKAVATEKEAGDEDDC